MVEDMSAPQESFPVHEPVNPVKTEICDNDTKEYFYLRWKLLETGYENYTAEIESINPGQDNRLSHLSCDYNDKKCQDVQGKIPLSVY
jgi:hypothetical protein